MTLNKFIEIAKKKIEEQPQVGEFDLLVMCHDGYVYDISDTLRLANVKDGVFVDGKPTVVYIRTT